jgi:hypothetical protein
MDRQTLYLSIASLLMIYFASRFVFNGRSSKYKLPPRVPGVPIFGNALQVPPTQQGPWAKALAEKYGEMYDFLPEHSMNWNLDRMLTVLSGLL